MRIECCCCGRQIVNYDCGKSDYITSGPPTVMGIRLYACVECSSELDEYGLFPEEREEYDKCLNKFYIDR